MSVPVREEYRAHTQSRDLKPYVEDLLRVVPPRYLVGLDFVLLTDSEGRPRAERRMKTRSRGKKRLLRNALGYYQPAYRDGRPYIVLHIDQIKANQKRRVAMPGPEWRKNLLGNLGRPFLARWRLAEVLYHEIGHHIHFAHRPEFREPENVAERYRWELTKRLITRRWYFFALAMLAILTMYPLQVWQTVRKAYTNGY